MKIGQKHTELSKLKIKLNNAKYWLGKKRNSLSKEWKNKIAKSNKNKIRSKETKEKISKGRLRRKERLGFLNSIETRKKISLKNKGKHSNPNTEFKKGSIPWNKGKPFIRMKRRNNPLWKGGITPLVNQIRNSIKYQEWRQQIFIRDNFTCQECKIKSGCGHTIYLEAHHITSFHKLIQEAKEYMSLLSWYDACMLYTPLWDISNGITYCKRCHRKK